MGLRVSIRFWQLLPLFLAGHAALAMSVHGLPVPGVDEVTLYQRDGYLNDYREIPWGQEKADQYYLQWQAAHGRYVWVSGADRKPIRGGSVALGWRFGFANYLDGSDWFLLVDNSLFDGVAADWSRLPSDPCVHMENWDLPVRDCPANGWSGLGSLGCEIKLSSNRITAGDRLLVRWKVQGPAEHFFINDEEKTVSVGDGVVLSPTEIGGHELKGKVVQHNGYEQYCWASYEVVAPAPPPPPPPPAPAPKPEPLRCTVTAEPASVPMGSGLVLSVGIEGKVTQVFLDQQRLEPHLLKRIRVADHPGVQTALGKVKGPDGEATCWTQYNVTR